MDWATQPDPFRRWEGTEAVLLPFPARDPEGWESALWEHDGRKARPFDDESIASFLLLSVGITAWKSAGGSSWPLRANPSSGNLHPTEVHLVVPARGDDAGAVVHYSPVVHALEVRAEVDPATSDLLYASMGGTGLLVALTSITSRESWKYGERAFRYCNHDAGHALAALAASARLQGWHVSCLEGTSDDQIDTVFDLGRTSWPEGEREHPDLVVWVHPPGTDPPLSGLAPDIVTAFGNLDFRGTPSRLSRSPMTWDVIDSVVTATRKPVTTHACPALPEPVEIATTGDAGVTAAHLVRTRRSGIDFDGETSIPQARFEAMLARTLPAAGRAPFDCGLGPARVHLFLFVHRVDDLAPGIYCLVRDPSHLPSLRASTRNEFRWTPASDDLPLYLLQAGDWQERAIRLSCGQDIAGDSAFSLGMVARFSASLDEGACNYRRLFWETGMIGHVLYLEAEVHGMRGTGIGCYFDDPVHEALGLAGDEWQSLYHFTVGGAVDDPRLATLPPYHHLERRGDPRIR
jgi:SagB-type dehydrogenase family enzyme